jgi:hypothetical protein
VGPVKKYPIGPVVNYLGGDVGGGYRSGRQKIRCINPAHDDRRPSASVDYSANRYTCFSCGLSGDAIDLLRLVEGLAFDAAVALCESLTGGEAAPVRGGSADEPPALFGRSRAGGRRD